MNGSSPTYTAVKRSNRLAYELTPAEAKIVEWIRENSNGRDWVGTIRYVSGPNMYQMADHINRGQVSNRS